MTNAEYHREWYEKNKYRRKEQIQAHKSKRREYLYRFVDRYKLGCGCFRCGFKEHPKALELHHIEPSTKVKEVSSLCRVPVSLNTLKDEIRKCIVLCANCHRIEHYRG